MYWSTNLAGVTVQAHFLRDESDLPASIANDLLIVHVGLGGDLTEHHDHTGLGAGLACNLALGILLQARIEDGVRDLGFTRQVNQQNCLL